MIHSLVQTQKGCFEEYQLGRKGRFQSRTTTWRCLWTTYIDFEIIHCCKGGAKDEVYQEWWWIRKWWFLMDLWNICEGICERLTTVVGVVFLILFFDSSYLYFNIKMICNVSFEYFVTCDSCLINWKRVWNNRYFQRSPVLNFYMRTNLWHDNLFIYPK